jgi:hypothetical protein
MISKYYDILLLINNIEIHKKLQIIFYLTLNSNILKCGLNCSLLRNYLVTNLNNKEIKLNYTLKLFLVFYLSNYLNNKHFKNNQHE